jgi:RHS repeat-associated protein
LTVSYDDFGDFRLKSENVSNSYCYTGQEMDEEPSGLYNLRARYYAPGIGRFTQEDPLMAVLEAERVQELNGYNYVSNNPINLIDPLGLMSVIVMPDIGYDYCMHPETFGEMSFEFEKCWLKCMLGVDVLLESYAFSRGAPIAGKGMAMLYYHHKYPKWFKAWGRSSKVLVPRLGARIATGISLVGWGLTAYDAYKCYDKCQEKDAKKTPFDPVKYYIAAP